MAVIIKPVVTEKMTKMTDKSSQDRKLVARSKATAEKFNAEEEKRSYTYKTGKKKGQKEVSKEKTVMVYTRKAQPKYGFIVKPDATKFQIKNEVENMFNVKVVAVNTMRYAGKRQARYTKAGLVKGQKNSFKKAIVTLQEGDTIDFYSNI